MSAATDGRVHVSHPETGGEALVSAEPDVVALYEAKGWVVSDEVPAHLDPDAPDASPAEAPEPEPAAEPAADSPAPAPDETPDDTAPADDDEEEVIERG